MPYRDDLDAAYAQIHSLKQQLKEKPPKEEKVKCKKCGDWDKPEIFGAALGLAIVCAFIAFIWITAGTHGDLGKCYIETRVHRSAENDKVGIHKFWLSQEINWGTDNDIGVFHTLAEAKNAADMLGCPLVH